MRVSMISYDMTFLDHMLDQIGVVGEEIPDDKKCSRNIVFFLFILDGWRVTIFKAGIECKIDYLLVGIFGVVSIILL